MLARGIAARTTPWLADTGAYSYSLTKMKSSDVAGTVLGTVAKIPDSLMAGDARTAPDNLER